MRATTKLALLLVATLAFSGCTSFTFEARGGGSTVPEPPPERGHDHDHSAPARLHIPPGHFPPPGQCRVWHPGAPPGHQPPPGRCSVLEHEVGPGDWLIYRPSTDKEIVRVSFYDSRSPRVRIAVRIYDYRTGEFLREL